MGSESKKRVLIKDLRGSLTRENGRRVADDR
jgi:hypothetical protein